MAFLSPLLLLGLLSIAAPIALHLRRRREPVRVEFPALRLLKRNRHRTETRLRLRRWVLLALRSLLLALLAAALARPILRPPADGTAEDAGAGPAGTGVAVALVIDNGPNSAYQSRNRSRLEVARELAGALLAKLPRDAPVVLADRSPAGAAVAVEAEGAAARVARLRGSDAARPLATAVADALARLAGAPAARREAYVFTDLSDGAWDDSARRALAAALDAHAGAGLRLVDVGVAEPRNASVLGVTLPSESLAVGEPLAVTAEIHLVGPWSDPLPVQLWLDGDKGPVKRDERLVAPDTADAVEFTLAGIEAGFATGFVRVVAGDAAPADDVRHFAVRTRGPRRVLLVAPREEDALFVRAAIDPAAAEPGAARRYDAEFVSLDAWGRRSLAGYDAALLIDPPDTIERGRGWRRLYDLAAGGGGVGLFLGPEATLDGMNSPDAQSLLPAPLEFRSRDATYLRPTSYAHPAIRALAPYADAIPWPAFPVMQRWELGELRRGATAVARYADGGPAIVEHAVGRGRVLTMTTPVSGRRDDPDAWNLLPTGDDPWPFVLLADALTDYLTGGAAERLAYTAGETVVAPLPAGEDSPGYVLRSPSGEAARASVPPGVTELSITAATAPGAYRVEAGGGFERRFVVNLDPSAGRLARVPFAEIADSLGRDRVGLIAGPEELARSIDLGRVGRELYGWVLALAAAALIGEQWVGARYYREASGAES